MIRKTTLAVIVLAACLGIAAARAQAPPESAAPQLTSEQEQRLAERERLWTIGAQFESEGKLPEAIAAATKALAVERRLWGDTHDELARSLEYIAQLHFAREDFAAARTAYQEALTICTKLYGAKHWRAVNERLGLADVDLYAILSTDERRQLVRAKRLLNEVAQLQGQGKFAEAIPAAKEAADIYRHILGESHREYANSLSWLGILSRARQNTGEAAEFFRRALAINEQSFGATHPNTVAILDNLADSLESAAQGDLTKYDFAAARKARQEVLDLRTRLQGEKHWKTLGAKPAMSDVDLMEKFSTRQQAQLAEITRLDSQVVELHGEARYVKATVLAKQSLAIREELFGVDYPNTATSLNNLASLYLMQGNYGAAEPFYQRALAIIERTLGPDHPDTAGSLNNLATLYFTQGNYAVAEPLYRRALAIREQILGPDHPDTAGSLNNLATLYSTQGNYAAAEPLYRRALAIREQILGPEHPDTAVSLNSLALLYCTQWNYAAAEPLYQRALAIREQILGPDHPDTAVSLNNLALLYEAQENYGAAEPLYQRALVIHEKKLGPDHPDTATSLNNLATLYLTQANYAAAEPLYQRALLITEKTLGLDHPDTAGSLNNLATLYLMQGNYVAAEPLYRRAMVVTEKTLGRADHPNTAGSLNNLATLYLTQGNNAAAEPLFRQALVISRRSLDLTADLQSERRQLAMTDSLRYHLDSYLDCLLTAGTDADAAYTQVLAWKGAVLARQHLAHLARSTSDLEVSRTLAELQNTAGRLATLAFATPPAEQRNAWQKQLAELSRRKEELESDLSRLSAEFRRQQAERSLTAASLQAVLPADGLLIDLLEFWHNSPPRVGQGKWQAERRLAAFVVRRDGPVVLLDLGPVEPIAAAVDVWRRNFAAPEGAARRASGDELRRLLWAPLLPHLTGATLVLVSPDGPLTRFPLAALPGSKPGTFLIEEVALAVVPVPQMLPGLLSEKPRFAAGSASLLALGAVDFGASQAPVTPTAIRAAPLPAMRAAPRGTRSKDRLQWGQLPGTKQELEVLQATFRRAFHDGKLDLLTADQATEQTLRDGAPRHRFLHLATHGFFAPAEIRSALALGNEPDRQRRASDPFGEQGLIGFHPGLLSGIVLAGANQPPQPDRDDGILTALEVAELDLSQVDLAVLSACETGLGQAAGGEGVLGLQRAFQSAGARTTVTSLWKVDDAATRTLMTEFYKNLWERKLGKLEALRQAQLTMLRSYDAHDGVLRGTVAKLKPQITSAEAARPEKPAAGLSPYYWAAFVLAGDWR